METTISVISIVISFLGFLLAVFSFKGSREAKYKANRPILTLSEFKIFLDRYEMYVGGNVPWGKNKSLENSTYEECIRRNAKNITKLEHNNKDYLFINFCPKDTSSTKKAILAFDVLNIKIDFSNNDVSKLRIKEVFSIGLNGESFIKDFKVNAEFTVSEPTLELPIAFACIHDHPTAINLQKIQKFKKSVIKNIVRKPIDLLQSRGNVDGYIGFVETGYLLECKTIDGYIYAYSLCFEVNKNGTLILEKIQNGRKLFDEKVKKRLIVQEAITKREWERRLWLKKL